MEIDIRKVCVAFNRSINIKAVIVGELIFCLLNLVIIAKGLLVSGSSAIFHKTQHTGILSKCFVYNLSLCLRLCVPMSLSLYAYVSLSLSAYVSLSLPMSLYLYLYLSLSLYLSRASDAQRLQCRMTLFYAVIVPYFETIYSPFILFSMLRDIHTCTMWWLWKTVKLSKQILRQITKRHTTKRAFRE